MFHDVRIQHLSWINRVLQDRWGTQSSSRLLVAVGHLLWCLSRSYWLRRCRRNFDTPSQSSDNLFQSRMLRSRLVSHTQSRGLDLPDMIAVLSSSGQSLT
jgi:hypothetical protein